MRKLYNLIMNIYFILFLAQAGLMSIDTEVCNGYASWSSSIFLGIALLLFAFQVWYDRSKVGDGINNE